MVIAVNPMKSNAGTSTAPRRDRHTRRVLRAAGASLCFAALLTALLLLPGCVHFVNKPLSPEKSAQALEARSLTNEDLKVFLEKNLHRDLAQWPAAKWDFDMLMLATFYYQPSLEVARAEWRQAQGGTKTAAGRPNPTVSPSIGYDNGIANNFTPWLPGITFDVPLETAGKRKRRIQQAEALSASARFKLATAAWQARSDLRNSLLDWTFAQRRVEALQRQVGLQQDIANRLRQELEAGAIASTEITAARVALARSHADLAAAQRTLATSRARVAESIGVSTTALKGVALDASQLTAPGPEALSSANMRSQALQRRTDILGALAEYAASQSALQLEIAKQYPDVHLTPGYLFNQGNEGDHEWQLGATVELPILNQNQGPIAEAEARRTATAARFLALQAKVIADIDRAVATAQAGRESLSALRALAAQEQKQRENVQSQLNAGATDRLELLNAELTVLNANVAVLDEELNWEQALGALEDAVQWPIFGNAALAPKSGSPLLETSPTAAN